MKYSLKQTNKDNTDKLKICGNCKSYNTNNRKVNGKVYPQWYIYNKKKICRKCWEKLSPIYKSLHINAQKTYYNKNPEKIKAHQMVTSKKLKSNICENCGIIGVRLEGHHFDYSKPDKIITLCVKCHKRIHYG